jgi:ribosomal protein S18 acetylase RimI-like enzyme
MPIDVRILGLHDLPLLQSVAAGVFDHPVDSRWAAEFLADSRHHLSAAIDDGQMVGFASAVHYIHPDKPPQLWVNEVGVCPSHRNRGLGRRIIDCLLAHGRSLGCQEAWVLTDEDNEPARRLYAAGGGMETRGSRVVMVTFALASPRMQSSPCSGSGI